MPNPVYPHILNTLCKYLVDKIFKRAKALFFFKVKWFYTHLNDQTLLLQLSQELSSLDLWTHTTRQNLKLISLLSPILEI